MKKRIWTAILLSAIAAAIFVYFDYRSYSETMQNVTIIHYIVGSGSGYSTVYLTAIVPLESYQKDTVLSAIQRYVRHRNKGIPDSLQIVLYNSMEQLQKGESYFVTVFRPPRECKPSSGAKETLHSD